MIGMSSDEIAEIARTFEFDADVKSQTIMRLVAEVRAAKIVEGPAGHSAGTNKSGETNAGPDQMRTAPSAFSIPDRIAVDARGYGWRVWNDEDYWSMVPTTDDNLPIPEPIAWFERAACPWWCSPCGAHHPDGPCNEQVARAVVSVPTQERETT